MQVCYHITQKGLLYAISSRKKNTNTLLLIHILENYQDGTITFEQICIYFSNNKKAAFSHICKMIELQVLDIDETPSIKNDRLLSFRDTHLSDLLLQESFVLSDLSGLPIIYAAYNHQQALHLAAVAYDFIRVSARSRYLEEQTETYSPVSLEMSFQDKEVSIFLLHLSHCSFLLSSTNPRCLTLQAYLKFISFLIYRYDNE